MDADTARLRARTRAQIHNCHHCPLHETCRLPVPFTGPTPARLAIIGEAPGQDEDNKNTPFVGPSGRLIRAFLSDYRIDPATAFIMNSICCRPPGNRSPKVSELEACRGNYDAQLKLADPDFVLVLGATALSTIRPDLKVTNIHGHPFVPAIRGKAPLPNPYLRRPVYFPTFHPAAGLRDVDVKRKLTADIALLAQLLNERSHLQYWPTSCVKCGGEGWKQPVDLLTYCPAHFPARGAKIPDPPGKRDKQMAFA